MEVYVDNNATTKCDEDVLSLALFEAVATEFLTKKYQPKPEVEVDEFEIEL